MGKSRNRRNKNRPTPPGVPNLKVENGNSKDQSSTEIAINSLLGQLQVCDVEENLCGLRRLAELFFDTDKNIINDPSSAISKDLHTKFIKTVAPLLVDPRTDISNTAAGALRNLSVAGGLDMCEIMMENDVMTPLVALINKYSSDSSMMMDIDLPEDQNKLIKGKCDTLIQAVHILLNLCESSDIAVKYFNNSNLLPTLTRFLNSANGGIELAVVIAQCLHIASDNNPAVLSELKKHEEQIVQLILMDNKDNNASHFHLKALATGILFNIYGDVPLKYLNLCFQTLLNIISTDSREDLCKLSSLVPLEKDSVISSDGLQQLDKLQTIIDAQITTLEILTNICSGEEDEMEMESLDESDDIDGEDCDLDNFNGDDVKFPLSINSEIREALIKFPFLDNAYNKINLPANVADILLNHMDTKNIIKKYQRLRARAFHFMNNLITVLDIEDLGNPDSLFKIWTEIGKMITNDEKNEEIIEAATASMRASLAKLVIIKHPGLSNMSASDLGAIFKIVEQCKNDTVCTNVVQLSSALGVYCSNKNLDDLLKDIGQFLLNIAERQSPLWLIAEALDAIMDVFAEDNTDKVVHEISMIPRLATIAPSFRKKVKSERKLLGDHTALVNTANNNIFRFIKYKNNRLILIQNRT